MPGIEWHSLCTLCRSSVSGSLDYINSLLRSRPQVPTAARFMMNLRKKLAAYISSNKYRLMWGAVSTENIPLEFSLCHCLYTMTRSRARFHESTGPVLVREWSRLYIAKSRCFIAQL